MYCLSKGGNRESSTGHKGQSGPAVWEWKLKAFEQRELAPHRLVTLKTIHVELGVSFCIPIFGYRRCKPVKKDPILKPLPGRTLARSVRARGSSCCRCHHFHRSALPPYIRYLEGDPVPLIYPVFPVGKMEPFLLPGVTPLPQFHFKGVGMRNPDIRNPQESFMHELVIKSWSPPIRTQPACGASMENINSLVLRLRETSLPDYPDSIKFLWQMAIHLIRFLLLRCLWASSPLQPFSKPLSCRRTFQLREKRLEKLA